MVKAERAKVFHDAPKVHLMHCAYMFSIVIGCAVIFRMLVK